jgi:hypothetical protein
MHYRPFRFGVATGSAHSRAEWVSRACRTEEHGYATLVVADHLTTVLAPLSALALAASCSVTISATRPCMPEKRRRSTCFH